MYDGKINRHCKFFRFTKMSSKLPIFLILYSCLFIVLLSLCFLGIILPIWLAEIDELEKTNSEEFATIRVSSTILIFFSKFSRRNQKQHGDNCFKWSPMITVLLGLELEEKQVKNTMFMIIINMKIILQMKQFMTVQKLKVIHLNI